MNRSFISVIAGGFGTETKIVASGNEEQGEVQAIKLKNLKV
jgi:NAD/NADP transhydrogenase beta subunit